ncbi:DNA-binding response regulator [Clostridia bacterium]|nr:DNA-binding response regulator [Clostridia bacterium]
MIYVLEDESSIRQLVVYTLTSAGFEARGFACAREFWTAVRDAIPSMALLDIMLPDENGLDVLKKLRSMPVMAKTPVMMLTAMSSEYDKVVGLDLGADDYLPKPFGMMELVARVRSLARRTETIARQPRDKYQLGTLYVNIPERVVTVGGESVPLTLKEFDTLACLLRSQGIVLTRDQIMTSVWGYDYDGESRTVDVHIRSIRQKLTPCEDVIETVRGMGYRAVKRLEG